jgi:hypothetical protein
MFLKRSVRSLCIAAMLGAVLVPAGPAWARTVRLEATAPLQGASDPAIERALTSALDRCVRRATAMGLAWIWLDNAAVLENKVVVQMVATDEEPDEGQEGDGVRVMELARHRAR